MFTSGPHKLEASTLSYCIFRLHFSLFPLLKEFSLVPRTSSCWAVCEGGPRQKPGQPGAHRLSLSHSMAEPTLSLPNMVKGTRFQATSWLEASDSCPRDEAF